jgi:molecular chaperone GrpE
MVLINMDDHFSGQDTVCLDEELGMHKKHKPEQDVATKKNIAESVDKSQAENMEDKAETLNTEQTKKTQEEESLKDELLNIKDRYLRLAADFENYKKIIQREQQNNIKYANENLIIALLPIIDSLEQAIIMAKKSSDSKSDVLVGVEMVLKQLLDLFKKFGVEVFSAQGMPFDPARHEALSEQEADDKVNSGTVIVEYQKGYLLNGRLLRPARVAVAK